MALIINSRTNNAKKSILCGFIYKLLSILLPFASRTIIINFLGVEYTGLSRLFTSILSVLSLAELGIGSALIFSMYKPISEDDINKVNAFLYFYRKCYRIIGFIVFGIGIVLLPFIKYLISGDAPDNINVYVLFLIYLFQSISSYFLFAYKGSILTATQRNDIKSNISTIVLLLKEVVQLISIIIFRNYYFYALALPSFTILENVIINIFFKKLYPEIRPCGNILESEKK